MRTKEEAIDDAWEKGEEREGRREKDGEVEGHLRRKETKGIFSLPPSLPLPLSLSVKKIMKKVEIFEASRLK